MCWTKTLLHFAIVSLIKALGGNSEKEAKEDWIKINTEGAKQSKHLVPNLTANTREETNVMKEMAEIHLKLPNITISSEVEEFVYSPWYSLIFCIVNKSTPFVADVSSLAPEISQSLSKKLSVPPSVFGVTSIIKYTSSDTFLSVNLTLMSPIIHRLHYNLCNLHKSSPFFLISGTKLELYQVKHDQDQHIYITQTKEELSLLMSDSLVRLISVSLGVLGLFLVVLGVCFTTAQFIFPNRNSEPSLEEEDSLLECQEWELEREADEDIFIIQTGGKEEIRGLEMKYAGKDFTRERIFQRLLTNLKKLSS